MVEVENVLRADEPRPSLPGEEALASAPDAADGGFRVPSPGAGMSEMLELTAAEAAARVRAGDLERGELWRFYRDRALADDLNAFTWVCDGDDRRGVDPRPARRRADRDQGPVLHRGRPVARRARRSSRTTARRTRPRRSSGS